LLKTPELSAIERETRMRLFGAISGQSSDYFFTGELAEEIVGTTWYCTPATCKEIAYMGEVFTVKEHRERGVATNLLDVAVDFFRNSGGRAIYVTNLCPHAPHQIFRRIGFQAYGYGQHAYGGIIRLTVSEKPEVFDQEYYRHDSTTSIRSVNWGDLPHFIALLNHPHPWIIRAYSIGLIGYTVFDELGKSFMSLMNTLKRGNFGFVLENSRRRVMGTAYSSSLQSRSQSHVKTVDFLVHPNYLGEADQLLKTFTDKSGEEKIEKLQAYAAATDESRVEILRSCGFEKEATMPDQLRIGGKKTDLEIYSKFLRDDIPAQIE